MALGLPEIFAAEKTAILSDWTDDERGRQRLILSLEIEGAAIEGLNLRATANRTLPDREVMFQLEYEARYRSKDILARIDWRPLKSHRNGDVGPKAHRLKEIAGSHYHSFALNWVEITGRMRQPNLPIAKEITPDPANFRQLLALVSKEFRISNLAGVPLPAWDLLL